MKGLVSIHTHILMGILLVTQSNDPGFPGLDPDVPIDGGLGLLLFAGAVYGMKKIREIKP